MAGDLVSSFTKRRMGLEASSMAPGIDQVPELALPLLLMMDPLGLSAVDVALGVAVFWLGELALSRLLFRIGMRDRPYQLAGRRSSCRVISGGQFRRTATTLDPHPTEV